MMLALLWILAVPAINLLSAQASVYDNRVVHIHKKGNDSESCLTGQDMRQGTLDQYCKTMGFVADKLRSSGSRNVTIILESKIQVSSAINFSDHEILTIQGRSKDTNLNCRCNKADSDVIGISFIHITKLKLRRLSIMYCCGVMNNYSAGIFIQDCSDVIIENSQIRNNEYSNGLILLNPSGEVKIRKCKFSDNSVAKSSNDISITGAGLHIEFSQCTLAIVTVVISHCDFFHNLLPGQKRTYDDPLPLDITKKREWKRENTGGGMAIVLLNGTNATKINITNCNFTNNRAKWGGGLCIYVQKDTYNSMVSVSNSTFVHNVAEWGGGGLQVRLEELDKKSQNHIYFEDTTFERNRAIYGGGTSVSTLLLGYIPEPGEVLQFINCMWQRNTGQYSPAVDLSPYRFQQSRQGYSPIPLFKDIKIKSNYVLSTSCHNGRVVQGIFVVTRFTVHFQGKIRFEDNSYTALYLISGRAIFVNCSVYFYKNQGIRGGAIALRSFSTLVINDSSHFTFINNSATRVGGGIYYAPVDQREYFSGQTCFLEYGGVENVVYRRNISFQFDDNKAPLGGTSIYSETIISCYYAYYQDNRAVDDFRDFFYLIGDFHFDNTAIPLATSARWVEFDKTPPLVTLPGKLLNLPLIMYDEFNTSVHSEIGLRVEDNEQVRLDNHFTVNNKTHVYGAPDQNATIVLSTPQQLCNIDYRVTVSLLPCPPGFYYQEKYKRCRCSADNKSHSYPAITKCNFTHFSVYVKSGYWMGYYPNHTKNESTLYTAFYPSIFKNSNTAGLLEITANSEDLSDFMCGNATEGILCGTCKEGYSAYYHSNGIICGENNLCRYGILFYILSDMIPTIIFFTIVMISGISFSSGALNDFVFFSQVVDVLSQELIFSHSFNEAKLVNILQAGHQLIYGIFNIEFFSVFPYCLWEGATILDALSFKYITTLLALVLVTLIVLTMNFSLMGMCCLRISQCKAKPLGWRRDSSITHGISTFLIICYGQYTRVSFFILTRTYLQGMPGVEPIPVTYYGGQPYFSNSHLFYAIPAIICTSLFVVLPPLFLLLYPLIPHLLSLCGINEHPVVNKSLQLLCINRLLPLFDSFQSCYKDKMRFYAGLYFLYRVAAFLGYMHSNTLPPVFLPIVILGIHSILHPYKSWKYNAIDALIFLDIAIINSLTEMIKHSLIIESNDNILQLKLVQLAFIYLPMVSLLLIVLVKVGRKIKSVYWLSGEIREPSEPSISVNRSGEGESEMALQPLNQLQIPLLNVGFKYTL